MNVSSTVAKLLLRVAQPIVGPALARATSSHPAQTANATARVTRLLARMPGATGKKAAIYLARRAPRNVSAVANSCGIDFALDLRDNLQRDLFYLGDYEKDLLALLLAELRAGDVFIDVGAHIGTYALPAARRVGPEGRVFAFEPALDTAARLEQNARRNGIDNLAITRSALGSTTGAVELRASNSSSYLPEDAGVRSLHGEGPVVANVRLVTFDDWAHSARPDRIDAVKIDVEGSEYDVLHGMTETLMAFKPRLVIVEVVTAHLERAHATPQMLEELAERLGYRAEGPLISEIASRRVGPFWPNAVLRPAV